jgi:thioredoxin 2
MAPAYEAAAERLEPDARLIKLNSDDQQQISGRLGIRSIPTMILFHGGREIARQSGAMPASQIVDWARQAVSNAEHGN